MSCASKRSCKRSCLHVKRKWFLQHHDLLCRITLLLIKDSKTVSTTVIPPSPFLGAPFTFALSTPYVPATPAEATVHTPSVVESDPTPANAPLVESAPTPPDAPLVESDPTPADAPLVEPSPTPADVPLVELAPTPPDAPPADALATPARTVAWTEPVPRLLSFQELSESAKGGQTVS